VSRTVRLPVSERDVVRDRSFENQLRARTLKSTDACDNMKAIWVNVICN